MHVKKQGRIFPYQQVRVLTCQCETFSERFVTGVTIPATHFIALCLQYICHRHRALSEWVIQKNPEQDMNLLRELESNLGMWETQPSGKALSGVRFIRQSQNLQVKKSPLRSLCPM